MRADWEPGARGRLDKLKPLALPASHSHSRPALPSAPAPGLHPCSGGLAGGGMVRVEPELRRRVRRSEQELTTVMMAMMTTMMMMTMTMRR